MLSLKTSVAVVILAGTAAVSAGASYVVTKASLHANVTTTCPTPATPSADNRGVPLGGPPLSTNQGTKW
jgi:hypothetical protein